MCTNQIAEFHLVPLLSMVCDLMYVCVAKRERMGLLLKQREVEGFGSGKDVFISLLTSYSKNFCYSCFFTA